MQRTGETGRSRADDQNICIQFFARGLHFLAVPYPQPSNILQEYHSKLLIA
jgi:hypothetical protein